MMLEHWINDVDELSAGLNLSWKYALYRTLGPVASLFTRNANGPHKAGRCKLLCESGSFSQFHVLVGYHLHRDASFCGCDVFLWTELQTLPD